MPMRFASWFRREEPVASFGPLDATHAEVVADLHAGAFARPWSAIDFERMLAERDILADGLFLGAQAAPVGFALSRRVLDEAEILTVAIAPEASRPRLEPAPSRPPSRRAAPARRPAGPPGGRGGQRAGLAALPRLGLRGGGPPLRLLRQAGRRRSVGSHHERVALGVKWPRARSRVRISGRKGPGSGGAWRHGLKQRRRRTADAIERACRERGLRMTGPRRVIATDARRGGGPSGRGRAPPPRRPHRRPHLALDRLPHREAARDRGDHRAAGVPRRALALRERRPRAPRPPHQPRDRRRPRVPLGGDRGAADARSPAASAFASSPPAGALRRAPRRGRTTRTHEPSRHRRQGRDPRSRLFAALAPARRPRRPSRLAAGRDRLPRPVPPRCSCACSASA